MENTSIRHEEEGEAIPSDPTNEQEIASKASKVGDDLQKGGEGDPEIKAPEENSVVESEKPEEARVDGGGDKVDDVKQEILNNEDPDVVVEEKNEENIRENPRPEEVDGFVPKVASSLLDDEDGDAFPEKPELKAVDDENLEQSEQKVVEENDDEEFEHKVDELVDEPKVVNDLHAGEEASKIENDKVENDLHAGEEAGKIENDKAEFSPVDVKQEDADDVVDENEDSHETPVFQQDYNGEDDRGFKQEPLDNKSTDGPVEASSPGAPVVSCGVKDSLLVKTKSHFKQLASWCVGNKEGFDSHSWASGMAIGIVLTCSLVVISKHFERVSSR